MQSAGVHATILTVLDGVVVAVTTTSKNKVALAPAASGLDKTHLSLIVS